MSRCRFARPDITLDKKILKEVKKLYYLLAVIISCNLNQQASLW